MELIINKENKATADNLQDPTSMETIIRYMQTPSQEGIEHIVVVQPDYDLSEVASPFMVSVDDNPSEIGEFEDEVKFVDYMEELLSNGVIRLVVHTGQKEKINENFRSYVDEPSDYDPEAAVMCIMLPPMYWIKLTGRKWE
jgi:hypothetical protein